MSLPKVYDWPRIRAALKHLSEKFPGDFETWQLIGGAACWFYRAYLERANDPDFQVPKYSAAEEQIWLSKDIDFMGLEPEHAAALFASPFNPETHTINFEGIEVDFLEEGLRLTARDVSATAREVRTTEFVFYAVEASLLYEEKLTLLKVKSRPQDRLHCALLEEFLKFEFCHEAEIPLALQPRKWMARARDSKTANLNFFEKDERLTRRLIPAISRLAAPEHRALKHWAKHHLPGYTE
ncbi:MAG: hypothetical protein EXS31_18015 [Pedosphaera sp.]|nr:hypothetical protein [Pedosphaera sp.]